MTTVAQHRRAQHAPWRTFRRAGADLAGGLPSLLTVTAATWWLFDLPTAYLLRAVTLYALLAVVILWNMPGALPGRGLGAANRLTLIRATLLLPIAALVLEPEILRDDGYWWIIVVSTVAMILDGVDGWMARRTGTATEFGGRFDMELDAFLMLALSVLVWLSGQTGPWVMLIGVIRYLFLAAGWIWPALQAELPPSWRRKSICVIQGVVLLVCLGPIIPPAMASVTAFGALVLLMYSFVVDVAWLAHGRLVG